MSTAGLALAAAAILHPRAAARGPPTLGNCALVLGITRVEPLGKMVLISMVGAAVTTSVAVTANSTSAPRASVMGTVPLGAVSETAGAVVSWTVIVNFFSAAALLYCVRGGF